MKKPCKRNPLKLKHGMSIGSNSAEMDDEFLFDCFIHYPPVDICLDPQMPGMILGGRTGAGKTAILRFIANNREQVYELNPSDMAMGYVANSDILNFVQNIGADLDLFFQALWKHVICIAYIRSRWNVRNADSSRGFFAWLSNQFNRDARKTKSIKYLQEWEDKFWITMDENIKEITEKMEKKLSAELGSEIHKSKVRGQYEKQLSTDKRTELAARARKIINADQLSDLAGVIDILHEQEKIDRTGSYSPTTYYLLIDKLDERWVDTTIRFRLIRALIEALRSFRRITNLKVVVALRADIIERVVQETKDLSFQREKYDDYFIKMRWDRDLLFELTRTRVRSLFKRQYSPTKDAEFEDLFPYKVGGKDPFDYIVERTLMRPRDVIAFINQCLVASEGTYEITPTHIKQAEKEYSRTRREALEQEWQSAFPTLKRLLDFIGAVRRESFTLSQLIQNGLAERLALEIASDKKIDFDPVHNAAIIYVEEAGTPIVFVKEVVSTLYRVGALGVKIRANDRISYSHLDEPIISAAVIGDDTRIRIHPMLHSALAVQTDKR